MLQVEDLRTYFFRRRGVVKAVDGVGFSLASGEKLGDQGTEALRLLRIASPRERLGNYPHQMSGGMRQRVVGGIAISCLPKLIIADEPTTALDATIQAQYLAHLKDLQRQTNVAMIFVSHDFGIVARMCDRVAVMYAGKIVETATVRELFSNPKHPYTIGLVNSVPRLDRKEERLASIEGQPPSLLNLPSGCRFAPRCYAVFDRCWAEEPPRFNAGPDHFASCWKVAAS